MRIIDVKVFLVHAGRCNHTIVKILTDEGLSGLGEATLEGRELAVTETIHHLTPLLIGQDPARIEFLWQTMFRGSFWRGGPILTSAISGIDIALWDLKGKQLGVPVYELLGGAARERVQMYTHVGGETPEEAAEMARAIVEEGYTAVKMVPFYDIDGIIDDWRSMQKGIAYVRAVREAVGDEIDILLDGHGRMTPSVAVQVAQAMEEFHPYFLEEPVRPENAVSFAQVKAKTSVPIATGERLFSKWNFRELIEGEYIDYVQPDLCHAGGISEVKKIATCAETHYIRVAPHNPNPLSSISTVACLHLDIALPNFAIQELLWRPEPCVNEVIENAPVVNNGYIELPTSPGLGVELNEEAALAHPYKQRDLPQFRHYDGSVADW